MNKILGIGNALVDIITFIDSDSVLDRLGLPKGSMQLVDAAKSAEVKNLTSSFPRSKASGGSVANTMYGIAKLGAPSAFIGSVGKDDTGDFFLNDMEQAGAKTFLLRRTTETGTAAAFITPDSERTFATHLGAAVEFGADDLKTDFFEDYDIIYVEGYLIINRPLVEKTCQIAKERGMKVALDLSSYNVVEANHESFRSVITNYADIVFANEQEAKAFTGKEPEEALEEISRLCDIAVVKIGKEGSLVKRGEERIRVGTLDVNCIDSTGAGDMYASGFLYGLANNYPLENCALIGSLLAGRVITITGARMNEIMWKEINRQVIKYLPK